MAAASLSACARVVAISPRSAASDFSIPSIRAVAAGSVGGLAGFGFETGDARGEPVDRGGIELRRGCRRLHRRPAQCPTDRDHQRRCHRAGNRRNRPRGNWLRKRLGDQLGSRFRNRFRRRLGRCGSACATSSAFAGSFAACFSDSWAPRRLALRRLRSPSVRWSAARAWAGWNRQAVHYLRACHRPSQSSSISKADLTKSARRLRA